MSLARRVCMRNASQSASAIVIDTSTMRVDRTADR